MNSSGSQASPVAADGRGRRVSGTEVPGGFAVEWQLIDAPPVPAVRPGSGLTRADTTPRP
jgi:hypothetical protein